MVALCLLRCCLQEVQTAQGQQLQLQGEQVDSSAGSYVVRDDTTVMQQICDFLGGQAARYVSESQVKAVLGFTGSPKAHRQWRRCGGRSSSTWRHAICSSMSLAATAGVA